VTLDAPYPGGDRLHQVAGELPSMLRTAACSFDVAAARARLAERGGYEVVLESPGLEVGVYALVAPEPDHQQPHVDDEVYIVLEGEGSLNVEDETIASPPTSVSPCSSSSAGGERGEPARSDGSATVASGA
jgi:hypothetical protein